MAEEKEELTKLQVDKPEDFKFHVAYMAYSGAWEENTSGATRTKLNELIGSYVYGDYVSGRIWALTNYQTSTPANKELLKTDLRITSFGIDEQNELYFCADDGRIYRIKSPPGSS